MANGNDSGRGYTLIDVAARIGPAACAICGACYAIGYALLFLEHPSLGGAAQVIFGVGFGIGGYSLGRGLRNATSLYVANEAEKRRLSDSFPTNTQIPAIAREMDLQRAGVSQVANQPITTNK